MQEANLSSALQQRLPSSRWPNWPQNSLSPRRWKLWHPHPFNRWWQLWWPKLIYSKTNCCVHNPGYHTYLIPIVGRYEDPHRRPQAYHEIDYFEHTRWILKDIRRRIHNLTWFGPNLAYVHGKRTWESFINKLDTKRSNLLLDTRIFTIPLNLCLDYKSIPSLYALSPFSSLSWFFRALHCCSPQLSSALLF